MICRMSSDEYSKYPDQTVEMIPAISTFRACSFVLRSLFHDTDQSLTVIVAPDKTLFFNQKLIFLSYLSIKAYTVCFGYSLETPQ